MFSIVASPMNICRIQLDYPNQLRSDSRDCSSSFKSEADESKQTYTAIIFNEPVKSIPRQSPQMERRQSLQSRQSCLQRKENNGMEDLLTVNSISKMMVSQKEMRNSATLFVNATLNQNIDKKTSKLSQRPVSAFTRNKKEATECLQVGQAIKECSFLENHDMQLSGKNCLEEFHYKFKEKEKQQISTNNEQKMVEAPNNYGYIAKSRLLSSKQAKRNIHSYHKGKDMQQKKALQCKSHVNFESLYKNLLINNRTSKNKDKGRLNKSQNLSKRQKSSLHTPLKIKQNGNQRGDKQNASALIIMGNQRNSIYTLGEPQDKINETKCSYFSNSLHKNHSKVPLTTEILKSMKKSKTKISKILQLNKESVVEPKLLIENVDISKKSMQGATPKTPSNLSHMSSQKTIAKYLTKQSYSATNASKVIERNPDCRFTVECKKVTYF